MNKIDLIGRLTKDPELRSTQTGKSFATFTLAVPQPYKKDAEVNADFIPCIAWEGSAEAINKYAKKGHRLAVCGKLGTSEYEKDNKRYKNFFVAVEQFEFLEPKAKDNDGEKDTAPDTSDIPF